jgi:enoyl-CoA hydratase/carnithine racemase
MAESVTDVLGPWQTLEVERDGPVLRVWLNRPDRRNAVANTMLEEIGDCFRAIERDFETRIVVLAGRGASFCAGADRKPPAAYDAARDPQTPRARRFEGHLGRRAARAIEDCEALTIARVQGHAIGGGFVFALACDFRVTAEDAVFSLPEVELGLPLSWAGVPRMIQEIGMARARELLIRCRRIDGTTAEQWGVAHAVVPLAELDAEVDRFVEDLLAKPELAVHMSKTQLRGYARVATLGDATEADGDLFAQAARDPGFADRMRGDF